MTLVHLGRQANQDHKDKQDQVVSKGHKARLEFKVQQVQQAGRELLARVEFLEVQEPLDPVDRRAARGNLEIEVRQDRLDQLDHKVSLVHLVIKDHQD